MAAPWVGKAAGVIREADLGEVRRAIALLTCPGAGVEVRGLPSGRSRVLPADDPDAVCRFLSSLGSEVGGRVLMSFNPVPPDLGRPARTADFLSRRWIMVDVDPVRPKDTNASDQEHETALEVAGRVQGFLSGKGWPEPVVIDSGNGYQLMYRVDLPNDETSRVLVKRFLAALDGAFSTPAVHVDPLNYPVTRWCRLPGTWVMKGPHSEERPHRLSRIVGSPQVPQVVPRALIALAAGGEPPPPKPRPKPSPFAGKAPPDDRSRAYALAALAAEVEQLLSAPQGGRNHQFNRSAFALGQLVGSGLLTREEVEQALADAARRIGLDEAGIRATLKSGLNAGMAEPRGVPEETAPAASRPRPCGPPPSLYTLPELLAAEFPPPRWAVEGILSEGLTILAGKPKLGKSWLALNLAMTLAAGGMALGSKRVQPGDVLYLALEDRWRRVQARARKVLGGLDCPASARLTVATVWPRQDAGGLDQLKQWLNKADNPSLVIIDVWARFRPAAVRGNRSAYDTDYAQVIELKEVIDAAGTSGMIVHHCKKGKAEDVLEEVSGTLGLAGSTDGTLVLTRARSENEAELFVTGRDVEEQQLALTFDPEHCCWKLEGLATERTASKYRNDLIAVFRANAGVPLSPKELAERMGLRDDQQATMRKMLFLMADEGLIRRVGYGRYEWPVRTADDEAFFN